MNECKKYSETTVGKRTQWKPVVFAVKIFAVFQLTAWGSAQGSAQGSARGSALGSAWGSAQDYNNQSEE